jgi:hypothetical protein
MACIGEAAMSVIVNDLLLFCCLAAFVTGIVIAAATHSFDEAYASRILILVA